MFVSRSSSASEASISEDEDLEDHEPVTSTVPELTGEDIPTMLKSDRPSWLYRRSRSRSPVEELDKKRRVVTTRQEGARSFKPDLVARKNEVCL